MERPGWRAAGRSAHSSAPRNSGLCAHCRCALTRNQGRELYTFENPQRPSLLVTISISRLHNTTCCDQGWPISFFLSFLGPVGTLALRREAQRGVRTTDSGDMVVERSILELESRRSMRGGWDVGQTATRKLQGGATAAPLLMLVRQTETLRSS